MAINVTKRELTPRTEEQLRISTPHIFLPAVRSPLGPIPPGQKIVCAVLAVSSGVGVDDQDALEAAIVDIVGIQVCKVHSYGMAPAAEDTPTDWEIVFNVETGFSYRRVQPEE